MERCNNFIARAKYNIVEHPCQTAFAAACVCGTLSDGISWIALLGNPKLIGLAAFGGGGFAGCCSVCIANCVLDHQAQQVAAPILQGMN